MKEVEGNGAYYAATEIGARYCWDTEAVIVVVGKSAGQAAMHLSPNADRVHLVVRGCSLAA